MIPWIKGELSGTRAAPPGSTAPTASTARASACGGGGGGGGGGTERVDPAAACPHGRESRLATLLRHLVVTQDALRASVGGKGEVFDLPEV